MNCEQHPERAGLLAVDLPSINVKRYLCEECKAALLHSLTPFKGKREAWESSPIQDERAPDGRLVYPEMQGLMQNARDYNRHE